VSDEESVFDRAHRLEHEQRTHPPLDPDVRTRLARLETLLGFLLDEVRALRAALAAEKPPPP
jgi:hypothetical protein